MNTRARFALFAILGAHLALTVWLSAALSIRVDETYSLHTTSNGFAYAVREALVWEIQPPLYFAALEAWRHLDGSIFFARLLSVLAVAVGVYIVGIIGSRYLSEYHRLPMTAAAAFNPFIVASAVDARVYGFVFLWSALLMWLFFEAYVSEKRAVGPRLAFAIVAVASLYTQYYIGFLLLAFGVALAAQRRWKDLSAFLGWMVPVVILFAPLVYFVHLEIATNVVNYFNDLSLFGNTALMMSTLMHMTLPVDWAVKWSRYLLTLVIVVLTVLVWRSDKASLMKLISYPLVITVIAVLGFVSAVTAAHMPITPHYAAAFYVPGVTLLFALISASPGYTRNRVIAVASIVLVISSIGSLISVYRVVAKPGDAMRVAAFISAHELPHERIAVFDAQSALPLAYYYRGSNVIVPVPRPVRYDRYDLRDIAIRDEADVRHALGYQAGSHSRVWLVTPPNDTCRRTPVNLRCELLYDFVASHYDTLIDRHFFEARVRLLRERR